jgi:hypothetical protein
MSYLFSWIWAGPGSPISLVFLCQFRAIERGVRIRLDKRLELFDHLYRHNNVLGFTDLVGAWHLARMYK